MKNRSIIPVLALLLLTRLPLAAQSLGDSMVEPVQPADSGASAVIGAPPPPDKIPAAEAPTTEPGAIPTPPPPANTDLAPPAATPATSAPDAKFPPLEQQKKQMEQSEEGYLIKDAGLNDIFQFLAKKAGRQYFHNFKINTPEFRVTGHLNDGNPLQQMEELAFMYGLTLYTKGNTIYALTQTQLNQLPSAEFQYQLRYLRPTDMEQIKELIKPLLTPGTGIVNFEPKTSTIIIIDSANKIEHARELLHNIDKAKGQIVIETKILRINDTNAKRTGLDWSSSLGQTGVSIQAAQSLNSMFGLPSTLSSTVGAATGDRKSVV